jgi:chlorobactene glucosyltransferase
VLLVVLSNAGAGAPATRARPHGRTRPPSPLVSLLVPARNEAANIGTCVRSLLAQTYPHLEVLVLDDRSEDDTRAILERERARDPRLVGPGGREPPPGWTGKNWACHQLSLAARGEVLLFADADTDFFDPDAVHSDRPALQASRADLLSGLPRQVLGTLGETLLVPMFYWAFLSFTPLALGLVWRRAGLRPRRRPAHGVPPRGLRRDRRARGHPRQRRRRPRPGPARRARGLACRILDATDARALPHVPRRPGGVRRLRQEPLRGLRLRHPPLRVRVGLAGVRAPGPVALLALHAALPARVPADPTLLAASVTLALVTWGFAYARLRLPIWPALIYPLTFVGFLAVAVRSFVDGVFRRDVEGAGRGAAADAVDLGCRRGRSRPRCRSLR